MRIINVIIQLAGIVSTVDSFVIMDDEDRDGTEAQIKQAEEMFKTWCVNNGWKDKVDEFGNVIKDLDSLLDIGYYENNNYDSVTITWSNVNL